MVFVHIFIFNFVWGRLHDPNISKPPVVESEIWTFFLFQAGHVFHTSISEMKPWNFDQHCQQMFCFFIWPFIYGWSIGKLKIRACHFTPGWSHWKGLYHRAEVLYIALWRKMSLRHWQTLWRILIAIHFMTTFEGPPFIWNELEIPGF